MHIGKARGRYWRIALQQVVQTFQHLTYRVKAPQVVCERQSRGRFHYDERSMVA